MMMTQPKRSVKTQPRTARLMTLGSSHVLGITCGRDTTFYRLDPLPSDFGRAYRLSKADRGHGPEESYDVCLMDGGRSTCECKGHLAHAHKGTVCKHIAALFQLEKRGLLSAAAPKQQPQPEPVALDDL